MESETTVKNQLKPTDEVPLLVYTTANEVKALIKSGVLITYKQFLYFRFLFGYNQFNHTWISNWTCSKL
ncbi:hypothetical protein BpHYR1_035350 [Brachionus plicatilis]|uniref:Uncharacterized protein n=1 Tax=Brachionus plicatilis TaxID=10195 RepID=A0A3M7R5R5_BRAPC|nr:hypothetical protein BpHYR1_035350 [Brachionus plicatilis]